MKLFKDSIENRVILVLVLFCLVLFRYDFTYNLLPYKVNSNDTLWNILEEKVYHNRPIAHLSIKYLRSTNPKVDFDKELANKREEGGYKVNIFFNKMTIIGPNNKPIISKVLILPLFTLVNHFIQVITHDFVVVALVYFVYINLKVDKFRFNLVDMISAPLTFFLVPPFVLVFLVFLLITISSFFYH